MLSIILSRRDFREYDQIVSLYTKEKGKVSAFARGVKKITSKNSAHLEPISLVDATIEHGKEIDHLTKVQPVEYFTSIRSDIEKSLMAGFVVSVTDTLTQEGERDVRIFELLLRWLKFVNYVNLPCQGEVPEGQRGLKVHTPLPPLGRGGSIVCLIDGFIVSLFHCLGFTPILDQCVVCSKTFQGIVSEMLSLKSEDRSPKAGFYFSAGGLICSSCRAKKELAGEEIFDCGLKEVSDMQMLLKGDWRLIAGYELSEDEQKKLHRLVYEYAVYHSERKIVDWIKYASLPS